MKYHFLSAPLPLMTLLVAPVASAQDATKPQAASTEQVEAGSAPTSAAPSASLPPVSAEVPVWRKALTLYELGEVEPGLNLLKGEVHRCSNTEGACTDGELGTLYACVGILLAGGEKNHQSGVIAFRKALSLDSEIILLPVYETFEVKAAFDEAKTGKRSAELASDASPAHPQPSLQPVLSPEEEERRKQLTIDRLKKRGFVLFSGNARAGRVEIQDYRNDPYYYDDYYSAADGLGALGGTFTVAGMPGENSGFTMGARARGGVFLTDNGPYGHMGASGLLGSTVGKRQDDTFTYFLGGLGFDYLPAAESLAWVLSFQGGVSLGGLQLGGTMDLEGGEDFFAMMMGLEIGFGKLL